MATFVQKVASKFVDEVAGAVAKTLLGVVIALILAVTAFLTGHPEIGLMLVLIGSCVLLGVLIGRRSISVKTEQPRATSLETTVSRGDLCILGGFYGANDTWRDVTGVLLGFVKDGRYSFAVNNTNLVGGDDKDPLPYVPKRLIIAAIHKRQVISIDAPEGAMIEIPK